MGAKYRLNIASQLTTLILTMYCVMTIIPLEIGMYQIFKLVSIIMLAIGMSSLRMSITEGIFALYIWSILNAYYYTFYVFSLNGLEVVSRIMVILGTVLSYMHLLILSIYLTYGVEEVQSTIECESVHIYPTSLPRYQPALYSISEESLPPHYEDIVVNVTINI
jgi:hypothetical protein